jgi:NADH-quinone oxidoreductase subunit N
MSTPLIWILFPGLVSGLLLFLQRWERAVAILATLTAALLAGLAWWLPVKEQLFIGSWTLDMADTWSVMGRRFILGPNERPALVILYLTAAFWCGAAYLARPSRVFVPLALGMVAIMTAAISVEPFLYAALLIELAILLSVPFLISHDRPVGHGILRYITLQSLGVPFILFSGWMLAGVETSSGDQVLIQQASVLLGLGFAFFLAIFPFHTWIPMLAEEAHPYAVGFVLLLLPGAISFFGLGFLDRYSWLRASQTTYEVLRFFGVLMVVIGGVWAAFQRHLGKMLGYSVIVEIGFSMLAISLGEQAHPGSLEVFFASLLPRGLGLGVWALALTIVRNQTDGLLFKDVQGIARRAPVAATALILAHFSIAGLPLLAGFPVRIAIFEGLAKISLTTFFWALIGNFGLLIGGFRTLAVFVMGPSDENWRLTETWVTQAYLIIGVGVLLVVGLFPQSFLPLFSNMSHAFKQLIP